MSDQTTIPAPDGERRTVLKVYGMICLMIAAGFIPGTFFFLLTLLLFSLLMPVARHFHRKSEPDSLTANHMTYIIRTVWIFTVIALALLAVATIYLLSVYDISPLQPCTDKMTSALESGQQPGYEMILPCVEPFMQANKWPFLTAGLGVGVPAIVYLLFRLGKGIAQARRNQKIENIRSWL